MFGLKPGDKVTAIGPFGDFLIKPSEREMVYLGGGAGMAPLRAHLSHLLESQGSQRKISFWYGARSKQEMFYQEYFEELARKHPNFCFHLALSEPQPGDNWTGFTGFIHEVLQDEYLEKHPDPRSIDFYLCGPPPMMKAANAMLKELGVAPSQISFDEF
jgi:Na(+)-translocating NADH:ubiquinone oxidoreductase F subunit